MTLIVRTNVIGNKGAHDKHVKFIDTERTEQVNLSEGTLSSLSDGSLLQVKAKSDSPTVYRNQELRSNLTRNLSNRDPFFVSHSFQNSYQFGFEALTHSFVCNYAVLPN